MIILDTDHVSMLQHDSSEAKSIERRLTLAGVEVASITIVTWEEQFRGWTGKLSKAK